MACLPTDIACGIREALVGIIMPILLPVIVLLVLVFVLPKAGWRGVVLAVVGIFVLLWWYGLIPGLPALAGYL